MNGPAVRIAAALVALTGACSGRSAPAEVTTTIARATERPQWPKIGRLAGNPAQMKALVALPGVVVEDHAQRKLPDGRWEVSVKVSDYKAIEELRRTGFTPELRDPIVADPGSVPR